MPLGVLPDRRQRDLGGSQLPVLGVLCHEAQRRGDGTRKRPTTVSGALTVVGPVTAA
jgi:hypothetical protein